MSNQLVGESSLYLRQHAENPVDWMPWGQEAFDRAKAENKPVLVSIGYSSCHWCHVMAHESFENDYIARLMNKHFVCIKVDREERPDVDRVYMEAVQMINQHGGWPLNMFCLPDGRPFYGGTYFPPEDRGQGLIPWPQLIMRVSDYFHSRREELDENADNIVANLEHLSTSIQSQGADWSPRSLLDSVKRITESFDAENGGFGGAPKFPPTMVIQFLLAMRQTRACGNEFPRLADQVDHSVTLTLDRMAKGGLFDQIGGGFCRYCVDAAWTIPHFEKMLYDNALILETYAIAWSRYRSPLYERVVEETIDWLEREMRLPSGLYAASVDADSPEGEGRFYCWTPDQLAEVLGEEAPRFAKVYRITDEGNFEGGLSYPQFDGSMEDRDVLRAAREKLRQKRSERPAPGRDGKELTFWNALAARALLIAGEIFGKPKWTERGGDLLDLLWQSHQSGSGLLRARNGEDAPEGFLDDYAAVALAFLVASGRGNVFSPERCARYRENAEGLAKKILEKFGNEEGTAFYFTASSSEHPVVRHVEWYDNATPGGNSLVAHLLTALGTTSEDPVFAEARDKLRASYAELVERIPNGVAYGLTAWCQESSGMVLLKSGSRDTLEKAAKEMRARCWRPSWLIQSGEVPENAWCLCVGKTCLPDFTSPQEAASAATLASQPR